MCKIRLSWVVGAALLFFAVPALAVDGVVLINQATVMSAGGFPYTITQPGSYRLSGNLTVPAGPDGIDINTDNVTLDLNGFTITGGGSGGNGVKTFNNNITVKNGSVRNFTNDVIVQGTHELVMDMHASIGSGGVPTGSNGIVVTGGVVVRCTAEAIAANTAFSVFNSTLIDSEVDTSNVFVTGISATNSAVLDNVLMLSGPVSTGIKNNGGSLIARNTVSVTGTPISGASQGNNVCNGSAC